MNSQDSGCGMQAGEPARQVVRLVSPFLLAGLMFLSGCGMAPQRGAIERGEVVTTAPSKPVKGGGYYLDDGPGDNPPPNLEAIPDAEPKAEPLHKFANNPYTALGQEYVPNTKIKSYKAQGRASWYGRRFHGKRTSSGEIYDMYGMSAAHPTLPIPSYVRVTHLKNNKSVVVRVNDRGPFHSSRLIDLSYTAAHKLGIVQSGSGMVEVESINPLESAPQTSKPVETAPLVKVDEPQVAPRETNVSGIYLQLGSFGQQRNAENFGVRVKQKLGDLAEPLTVLSKGGKYRVHLGPYADESEAAKVAELVKSGLNIAPVRVLR